MRYLALVAILLVGASAPPKADVQPWKVYRVQGFIRSGEGLQLFGSGRKRLYIETAQNQDFYLGFASDSDADKAEKLIDQVVVADGYFVTCGTVTWLVPKTIQLQTK